MYTYDFQATCLFFKQTDGCTCEERCTVIKQFRPILFVQEYTCMYILLLMLMLIVHNG